MRFGRVFYAVVLFVCVFEFWRLWNISPPEMAAHFNLQGNPDRIVPRAEFFSFQIKTLLIMIVISLVMQFIFMVLPERLMHMPNREYWLAPARRDDTLDRMSSFAAMMFGVILLAVQAAFELSVYANLKTPIFFNAQWMFVVMIASVIVIGLMLASLMGSFRTIPS